MMLRQALSSSEIRLPPACGMAHAPAMPCPFPLPRGLDPADAKALPSKGPFPLSNGRERAPATFCPMLSERGLFRLSPAFAGDKPEAGDDFMTWGQRAPGAGRLRPDRGRKRRSSGFTLLEVVVTIVILAFVGMIAAMTLNRGMTAIFLEREHLRTAQTAHSCMERVVATFENLLVNHADDDPGTATKALEAALPGLCGEDATLSAEKKKLHVGASAATLEEGEELLLVTAQCGTTRLSHVFGD